MRVAVRQPGRGYACGCWATSARSRWSRPMSATRPRWRGRWTAPRPASTWWACCTRPGRQGFEALHAEGARTVAEAGGARGRHALRADLGHRRRRRQRLEIRPHQGRGRGGGARGLPGRDRSCGPRWCSGRRTSSSTASPPWPAARPALPLIGGGQTRFQPVFVGDVAAAAASALRSDAAPGQTYELGGPGVYSFKALMELMLAEIGKPRACWCPCPSRSPA